MKPILDQLDEAERVWSDACTVWDKDKCYSKHKELEVTLFSRNNLRNLIDVARAAEVAVNYYRNNNREMAAIRIVQMEAALAKLREGGK
jgi:hypothetical protein